MHPTASNAQAVTTESALPVETVDLDLHPNEASDLLPLENEQVLEAHGWNRAFWSVLDEGAVEDCMAVIGHRRGEPEGQGSWDILRPRFEVADNKGDTEDAEVCARHDGWIYVVGSHYGSKSGPLEAKRAFLARFREEDLTGDVEECRPAMQIAMNRFRVHRAVNDALRAFGPPLLGPGPSVRKRFIEQAPKGGGKGAARRINDSDSPLNVEGAAFDAAGSLLLGLRYPVTAEGHPIVAELAGIPAMFEDRRAAPVARRFWILENVGDRDQPVGFRALHRRGDELHAIVGCLDASGKGSTLLDDHPEGANTPCSHYRFVLPADRDGGVVQAELVHRFEVANVEGLALGTGTRCFYVTDEDDRVKIHLMQHG